MKKIKIGPETSGGLQRGIAVAGSGAMGRMASYVSENDVRECGRNRVLESGRI